MRLILTLHLMMWGWRVVQGLPVPLALPVHVEFRVRQVHQEFPVPVVVQVLQVLLLSAHQGHQGQAALQALAAGQAHPEVQGAMARPVLQEVQEALEEQDRAVPAAAMVLQALPVLLALQDQAALVRPGHLVHLLYSHGGLTEHLILSGLPAAKQTEQLVML